MTTRLVTTRSLVDPYRAEVEDLIRYGFDRTPGIDDASIEIHVRLSNRSWTVHGTAYAKGIPSIATVEPGTTDLVTISIPHHRGRPDGRPNEELFLYVECSSCGYVGGSSLKVLAEEHGRGHVAYMAKKEAGR